MIIALPLTELRYAEDSDTKDPRTPRQFRKGEVEKIMAARCTSDGAADFALCTSHNLAPIIQESVGLARGFHNSKLFKKEYKMWEKDIQKKK
jgi:hypothetical protein